MSLRPETDYVYDSAAMIAEPDLVLGEIRKDGDLVWSNTMRRWLALSNAAARDTLRNRHLRVHDLFGNFKHIERRTGVDLSDLLRISAWIPFLHDGAQHTSLRAVFARVLADLRIDYLDAFSEGSQDMLDALCRAGEGDLAVDYADRLHVEAIGRLAGIDPAQRLWIARNAASQGSIDFGASVSEMLDVNRRGAALLARIETVTAGTGAAKFMDRIGDALRACGVDDTHAHRVECLTALLLLGRDTLAGTVTLGLAHLFGKGGGNIEQGALESASSMTDEIIRLSSAVQISIRVASCDLLLRGQTVKEGEMVMIFLQAANRDPEAFACPHRVDTANKGHVAFGAARHLCAGMPLSREAVGIALSQIAKIENIEALSGWTFGPSRNTRKLDTMAVRIKASS
jgi:cytochrome P450